MRFFPSRNCFVLWTLALLGAFHGPVSAEYWEYHGNCTDVQSLAAYGDYVWASTSGGLFRWNINDRSYVKIPLNKSNGMTFGQICVDPQGNVWSFRNNKLWKFDGADWMIFTPSVMISNDFKSIAVDTSGNIWIATSKEITKFDGITWQRFTEENGPQMGDYYTCVACDKRGNVWIGARKYQHNPLSGILSKYDGNLWTTYTYTVDYDGSSIFSMAFDSQGNVWLGKDHEISLFNGTIFKQFNYLNGFSNSEAYTTMAVDFDGNIWAGMKYASPSYYEIYNKGISKYDGTTWTTYTESNGLTSKFANSIIVDSKGKIWVGSQLGISIYDGYRWETHITNGIQDNRIYSLFADKKGNIWTNTPTGISMYDGAKWNTFPNYGCGNAGFTTDEKGNVWAGGLDSIWRFDGKEWKSFSPPDSILGSRYNSGGLYVNYSTSILANNGRILVSSIKNLLIFNGIQWEIMALPRMNNFGTSRAYSLAVDPKENIWIGRNPGASKFDGKTWTNYLKEDGFTNSITATWTEDPVATGSIAVDHQGNLWFGTGSTYRPPYDIEFPWRVYKGGAQKFDGITWTPYNEKDGLADNYVSSVKVDSQGNIWFGTWGGISMFDGNSWKSYTKNDGLIDNMVMTLDIDSYDNIWVGTYDSGICCLVRNPYPVKAEQVHNPESFRILGNSPNPFNSSTAIRFTLPTSGKAEVSVYSVAGQKVRTLLSELLPAGSHTVTWDGRDDSGKPVSTGVYLSRLIEGKRIATGKMLLLK